MTARWHTVFLDRDGTINVKAAEGEYVTDPNAVELLPGAAAAIRRLNESGRMVVVVSNQRGVARGVFSRGQLDAVTSRLVRLLAAERARVDAFYYCTHGQGECDCRKPLPGLLLRAARELDQVDLSDAMLVGDADSDIQAAAAAGVSAIAIGPRVTPRDGVARVDDLAAATELILAPG